MNAEQINEKYAKNFDDMNNLLQQAYANVQGDFDLSDDERADKAHESHEWATAYLYQLEEWRNAALAEREEDLNDFLYSATTVNGYDGSVVKEDFNRAQIEAFKASDEELSAMARSAQKTKNSTLATAVAAVADERGRDDITMGALQWLPKKLAAYQELKGIPSAEERAERLDRARSSIPTPSMSRIRPTAEMRASAERVRNVERMQRGQLRD